MGILDSIPARGRPAAPLDLEVVRPLEARDLLRLAEAPKVAVPALRRVRHTHHRYALLLAEGHGVKEVAIMCGVTPQRITQLLIDPAFAELLAQYQDSALTALADESEAFKGDLLDNAQMANAEIAARLEDDEKRKSIPMGELRKIVELGADRTVAPPKNAVPAQAPPQSITLNFGTSLRPPEPGAQRLIDVTPQAAPTKANDDEAP